VTGATVERGAVGGTGRLELTAALAAPVTGAPDAGAAVIAGVEVAPEAALGETTMEQATRSSPAGTMALPRVTRGRMPRRNARLAAITMSLAFATSAPLFDTIISCGRYRTVTIL
jgi:hypothetical protein